MSDNCNTIMTMRDLAEFSCIFNDDDSPLYWFLWDNLGDEGVIYLGWESRVWCVESPCETMPKIRCVGEIALHSHSLYAPGFPDVFRFPCPAARRAFKRYNPVYRDWLDFEENTVSESHAWMYECAE